MANRYKSKKWEKKREIILKRDKYECQECRLYGKRVDAQMVHHIFPAENYPKLFYVSQNLISLCNQCHNKMHDRNNDEISEKGKKLQRKIIKNIPPSLFI